MRAFRVIIFVVGAALLGTASVALLEAVRARSWPVVAAEISPSPGARYVYRIGGQSYYGSRVTTLDLASICPMCGIRADLPKSQFFVRYNPKDPARAVASANVPWSSVVLVGSVGAILLLIAALWRPFGATVMRQIAPDKVFNGAADG